MDGDEVRSFVEKQGKVKSIKHLYQQAQPQTNELSKTEDTDELVFNSFTNFIEISNCTVTIEM